MVTDRNDDYIDMSTTASTDISSSETSIQPTDATQSNSDISVSVSTTRTPVTTDNQDQTISPYMNSPRPGPTTAPATSTTVSTSSASTTKEPISTTPDMIPSTKPGKIYQFKTTLIYSLKIMRMKRNSAKTRKTAKTISKLISLEDLILSPLKVALSVSCCSVFIVKF